MQCFTTHHLPPGGDHCFTDLGRRISPGQLLAVDIFVDSCQSDADRFNFRRRPRHLNISSTGLSAFRCLRRHRDLVIKSADKGGAVAVWRTDIYKVEAHCQLHKNSFFRPLANPTSHNQKNVPPHYMMSFPYSTSISASYLIVSTPSTLTIYFLPQIHTPQIRRAPLFLPVTAPPN